MKNWPASLVQLGLAAPPARAEGGTDGVRSFVLHTPAEDVITASLGIGCAQLSDALVNGHPGPFSSYLRRWQGLEALIRLAAEYLSRRRVARLAMPVARPAAPARQEEGDR